jgi:pyruvate dehydrogenase (quinone)/pyruvate oxidase
MKEWNELMQERASRTDIPMKPQVVAHEIGKRLRNDAIVTCDSGTITTWWARHIPVKRGQLHSCSGNLATMACGLPYANAAQIAYPERQVICFIGDGGFSMLMCEFITAVKHKLPIKVCIIKNDVLGQIKWEQMVFLGNPEYGVQLQPIDYVMFAKACGAEAFALKDPKLAGDTVERWLAAPGPAILESTVDSLEAPMPAKIKPEQAVHFAESLARGEDDALKIAKTIFKDKVRELI